MARILVTGAAGFIGSHTVEEAVARGHDVVAIDNFNDYYDPSEKRRNAREVLESSGVQILGLDLNQGDLDYLLDGVDSIVHLAGQPGVRGSWDSFDDYVSENIVATERLLRASRKAGIERFVYASSSSVYGNAHAYPVDEMSPTVPFSPYGVSKLAGEHLVRSYSANFEFRTVCLRYFTVFGPRQRPDMAFNRLIRSSLRGETFHMHGNGSQVRDFTFVKDVARANLLSVEAVLDENQVANVSGGTEVSMQEVLNILEVVVGKPAKVAHVPKAAGDVQRTGGRNFLAREKLGWSPEVNIQHGLEAQVSHAKIFG